MGDVINQYPILGSRFTEVEGEPRQYIPARRLLAFKHEVIDHQVKVRGHRFALGEIEAILAEHPDVKSTAVITVDMREDRRIVAYVVGKDGQVLDQGDLKVFVGRQLPDYMVPSAFVCLEQMPLTPSGKINRTAAVTTY